MISTTDLTQLRASHAHMRLALKKLLEFDRTGEADGSGFGITHDLDCGTYEHGMISCSCGFSVAVQLAHLALEQAWEGE